ALPLLGCGPKEDAAERARVLHAIDALRDAPSDALEQRRKLLDDLARQAVTTPETTRARATCAAAYRYLLDGTELEKKVEAALRKDEPPTPAVAQDLIDAEAKIRKSRDLMPECEEAIGHLRLPGGR